MSIIINPYVWLNKTIFKNQVNTLDNNKQGKLKIKFEKTICFNLKEKVTFYKVTTYLIYFSFQLGFIKFYGE